MIDRQFKRLLWASCSILMTTLTLNVAADVTSDKTIEPRIIGGTVAADNAWPWMVGVLDRSVADNFYAQVCGGSLIHSEWVLTAAHCFVDENDQRSDGAGIDILIGTQSLSSGGQRIEVDNVVIHPNFESKKLVNDIALLHLKTPVTNVQPVSLPGNSYDLDVVETGASSTLIGWGTTSADSEPPISSYPTDLMQVDVSVVSNYFCRLKMGASNIQDTMMCTLTTNKDSCQGDSGGPMVTNLSGEIQQVGIISWGYGCAQPNYPGVNTRISKYEAFINDNMCSADKPATPTLSMTQQNLGNGYVAVNVNFSQVANATKYRLYYAPYVSDFNQVAQIRHIDMAQSAQYVIPSGSAYYIAGEAVNVNCISDLSNVVTVPGL